MVGPQVRRLRSAARLTQEEFAARCFVLGFEISGGSVSHIETGVRGVSDLEMVLLARALRCPSKDSCRRGCRSGTRTCGRPPRARGSERWRRGETDSVSQVRLPLGATREGVKPLLFFGSRQEK